MTNEIRIKDIREKAYAKACTKDISAEYAKEYIKAFIHAYVKTFIKNFAESRVKPYPHPLSLIHISEPTRRSELSRMPSSA